MATREGDDMRRGAHALGDHVHRGLDVGNRLAPTQADPHLRVAALHGRARGNEITEARESGERFCTRAERDPEARHLGEPSRDECGFGVVTETESLGDACTDGNHVLDDACDLAADDVGVRVQAKCRTSEHIDECPGDARVSAGNHARSRLPREDLAREIRPAQHRYGTTGKTLDCHFTHPLQRGPLQSLCQADDRNTRIHERRNLPRHLSETSRRNGHCHHSGTNHGLGQVARGMQFVGKRKVAEIRRVGATRCNLLRNLGTARPQSDLTIRGGERSDRRPPRAGTDDAHPVTHERQD